MIAFAPASHPTVAVAVVVPYQNVSGTGSAIAGPIMKCVRGYSGHPDGQTRHGHVHDVPVVRAT